MIMLSVLSLARQPHFVALEGMAREFSLSMHVDEYVRSVYLLVYPISSDLISRCVLVYWDITLPSDLVHINSMCFNVDKLFNFLRTCYSLSSPDRRKATVQVLMAHSDVWNLGKDNVDLRIKADSFARVQRFFPECSVVVANLEAHVQEA